MRVFILLFMIVMMPVEVWPQTKGDLLTKLSLAVEEELYEQAEGMLREVMSVDVESAEQFYWIYLGRQHAMAPKLAHELAAYFEKHSDYDKASVFYREYIQFNSEDTKVLLSLAKVDAFRGEETEAVYTYEKVLELQPDNLDANIYVANYYYLQAKLGRQQVEQDYKRIKSPTRMQYAHYRNELDRVFADKYVKAYAHFQRVLNQFSSVGARKAVAEIEQVKKEMEAL